jgi:general secretion pathway protein G
MKKGFTLIELMIVIIILGLLASLIMPNIMAKSEEAKEKLICVQMKNISETLKMFKMDNGTYPTTEEGLDALAKNPDSEKYKSYSKNGYFEGGNIPKDSWQNNFVYVNNNNEIDLVSFGADLKEGGEDDIYFSKCTK